MIRNASLTGDDHIVLHLHAPGDPGLRHDQTARADAHVVRDVHQIVDLRARPDDGVIHAAAIDARIRADFDVVPDEAAPHVRNLAVLLATLSGDVSEPVTPQHRPGMHDHALAQRGAGVERHARIQLRVVADGHAVTQHTSGADADIFAELHAGAETCVRADRDGLLPCRAAAEGRRRVNAGLPDGLRIQHREHDEQRRIRFSDHDASLGPTRRRLERGRDEHHRSAGALKVGDVSG